MPPSDFINYAVRPNKTVERKLLFGILGVMSPALKLHAYRYIGFGGLWFVDFAMAHRHLSIGDMISIERDAILATRASFNNPYSCVRVLSGESGVILPTLPLEEKPVLAWLDYEATIEQSVLDDLSLLCQRAPRGSIIISTINAHRGSLPDTDENGDKYSDYRARVLSVVGDLLSPATPHESFQTSGYPKLLASLLFAHMQRALRKSGRATERILPIFSAAYNDNAPMVTVGGLIVDDGLADQLTQALEARGLEGYLSEKSHFEIGVPPLTLREKAALDTLMPALNPPTLAELKKLGFELKPTQIRAYHRYYHHYPVFGELAI